ncbi:MAG: cytochrome c [Magnetococcus sp. THC-1_WYH]
MKKRGWVVIGLFLIGIMISGRAVADGEGDYRAMLMTITKLHLKAIDKILSGEVSHPEVIYKHARGFQGNAELLPHLYNSDANGRAKTEKPAMDASSFWKAVEDSQDAMTDFTNLAERFVEARSRFKAGSRKIQGLQESFAQVKSKCMVCHQDLLD